MRIIAGSCARLKLIPPRDYRTRPITDRVKEALFNVLQFHVEGAHVLDLFCGTGSLGLEALSRGAGSVCFVDHDADALRRLRQNITRCRCAARTTVLPVNAFDAEWSQPESANLAFVDPPYRMTRENDSASPVGRLLARLGDGLAVDSVVVVRHERGVSLQDRYGRLGLQQRREYGTMALTFLELRVAVPP